MAKKTAAKKTKAKAKAKTQEKEPAKKTGIPRIRELTGTSGVQAREALKAESMVSLRNDLREAGRTLGVQEARYLVSFYYDLQDYRKASGNQCLALGEQPTQTLAMVFETTAWLEENIKIALGHHAETTDVGRWCLGVHGMGPVLTSALLAHIDIEKAPTAGNIWSFAGLVPGIAWLGSDSAKKIIKRLLGADSTISNSFVMRFAEALECSPKWLVRRITANHTFHDWKESDISDEEFVDRVMAEHKDPVTVAECVNAVSKRPWNADLKTACWKISESFNKFKNHDDCFYGKLLDKKWREIQGMNSDGRYKDAAGEGAARVGKSTEAYKSYSVGMLPPAHVLARAKRWVVKLFLSMYHEVAYVSHYHKLPPKPFVIEHLKHAHEIVPPDLPEEVRQLRQEAGRPC